MYSGPEQLGAGECSTRIERYSIRSDASPGALARPFLEPEVSRDLLDEISEPRVGRVLVEALVPIGFLRIGGQVHRRAQDLERHELGEVANERARAGKKEIGPRDDQRRGHEVAHPSCDVALPAQLRERLVDPRWPRVVAE